MSSATKSVDAPGRARQRPAPRYAPIVFDLDGTLVDSAWGIANALNGIGFARESVDVAHVRALVSGGASHLIKQALKLEDAEVPNALQAFRRLYADDPCRPEDLFPGVDQTLSCLRSWDLRLAICTNKPQALAERVIHRLGLARYFDVVIGSDPCRPQKPDPAPLFEAATRLKGATPVLVGDSRIDALTAQAADAPFVYAAYGYERVDDMPVAGVAANLSEVAEILEKLLWPTAGVKSSMI
jgi:phosphoglycolate phosphatase